MSSTDVIIIIFNSLIHNLTYYNKDQIKTSYFSKINILVINGR